MLKFLLLAAVVATVVSKPQISFGEEEDTKLVGVVPKSEIEGEAPSDEIINTRLGLLASYLNLPAVPGAAPLSTQVAPAGNTANPYLPQGTSRGNCLCVPLGKCAPPQPGPGPAPIISDGAGLIDVRIVNRAPAGVTCQNGFQYCCAQQDILPLPQPGAPIPQRNNNNGCGRSNIIPVQGYNLDPTQAAFGEFPWMVVLLGPTNNYIGGGVLLTDRHVLTAAHKVASIGSNGLKVRLGEWDAKANNEPLKYIEAGVVRVKVNPFFNPTNLHNDIAILTLDHPVDFGRNPHVAPVCTATYGKANDGRRCWVTGWGKDAFGPPGNFQYILKKVDVPVLNSNDCENRLRNTRLGQYFQLERTSFICAGGEPLKDACTGDGGSPLVCEGPNGAELVGLVAWGVGCADPGIPGVYVNVPNYSQWIQAELV